jgi:hypothetical protein
MAMDERLKLKVCVEEEEKLLVRERVAIICTRENTAKTRSSESRVLRIHSS